MKATYFDSPEAFRRWLERHHASASELWVGFHKRATGKPSMTWPESVDEALCYGWIDGVRKSIDDDRYVIRFSRRRPTSNWSLVNVRRVKVLTEEGRMRPAGLAAYQARDPKRTGVYSAENPAKELPPAYLKRFKANAAAWAFYKAQPPFYLKVTAHYVLSAKQEETRERRLDRLINDSAAGRRIGILERPKNATAKPRASAAKRPRAAKKSRATRTRGSA